MLLQQKPAEAYRRVALDARIAGARPADLVLLCYEQLAEALGAAIEASSRADNHRRSAALTRALSVLTALQLGLDRQSPLAVPLDTFFAGVRRTLLDNVPTFDAEAIAATKADIIEVSDNLARVTNI
jgi:flagellin-specific chaperone FliS